MLQGRDDARARHNARFPPNRRADRPARRAGRDALAQTEARTLGLRELRVDEHEIGTNLLQYPAHFRRICGQLGLGLQISAAGADKVH